MRSSYIGKLVIGLSACVALFALTNCRAADDGAALPEAELRPNIIVIVADDLGYADLGFLGSEIKTPNIDALANRGTVFTRFYTSFTCSPTRAMLLSGVDNHLAGLGNMAETLDPIHEGVPGYEGYLNQDVANMAEIFNLAGYQTYMTGKWHLGVEHDQSPFARGFDKTFVLVGGGGSHFADRIGQDMHRTVAYYRENGVLVDALPDDYFSSNYFTDRLIEFIENGTDGEPYLGYLAFTAPHWPLQAPEADIQAQKGNYADGYNVIRAERLRAMKDAGLVPENAGLTELSVPAWDDLTEEQQATSARAMEVYAAMIENMDRNIGALIDTIEQRGELQNTVFVFLSDNGADGLEFAKLSQPFADWTEAFDNRLENIGHINSYAAYGSGWAHASEAPHRNYKGYMFEGGIRSPMILVAPNSDEIQPNTPLRIYNQPTTIRDILPTLMTLAGIENHRSRFNGRVVHPISGRSLEPALADLDHAVHENEPLGFEMWNLQALVKDDWKIVRHPEPAGNGEWALYDVSKDIGEARDLSADHPEILSQLIADYDAYVSENNVIEPSGPRRLVAPESAILER